MSTCSHRTRSFDTNSDREAQYIRSYCVDCARPPCMITGHAQHRSRSTSLQVRISVGSYAGFNLYQCLHPSHRGTAKNYPSRRTSPRSDPDTCAARHTRHTHATNDTNFKPKHALPIINLYLVVIIVISPVRLHLLSPRRLRVIAHFELLPTRHRHGLSGRRTLFQEVS